MSDTRSPRNSTPSGRAKSGAVDDSTAPTVSTTVVARITGEGPGYLKQGDAFYVYANVSDTGTAPSQTATGTSAAGTS